MDDGRLIDLFFARAEQAIAELDRAYGRLCRRLSGQILADPRDVEECVSDSYLNFWNAVPPARPDPLRTYLCTIVRRVSITRYHHNTATKRDSQYEVSLEELDGCLSAPDTPEAAVERKELTAALERFLDGLTRENRVIFLRRYWFADSYGQIAKQVGLSEKAVSVRLFRIRKDLRSHLQKEGFL